MTPPPQKQRATDDILEQSLDGWPLVSVVVPTYRRPELLRATVQSILDQRYAGPIEILVVFDRDEEPVRPDVTIPEHRDLRLFRNDRTPGPAGAYNVGLLASTGQYVALCDDDDEWLPDKLRVQIEAFRHHPDALLGTCGIYLGDGASRTRNPARLPKKEVMSLEDLLRTPRNEMHTSTMTFHRERMLREVGLVDEDIPGSYGEDYDWWIRAARVAPVVAVRRPLVRVRWQHSYFADRWSMIIDAITYQLERRPELKQDRGNLARLYGRLAFAHAAMGNRGEARRWARMSRTLNWRQPRIYLAYLVNTGLVNPKTVLRLAHALGRGV